MASIIQSGQFSEKIHSWWNRQIKGLYRQSMGAPYRLMVEDTMHVKINQGARLLTVRGWPVGTHGLHYDKSYDPCQESIDSGTTVKHDMSTKWETLRITTCKLVVITK